MRRTLILASLCGLVLGPVLSLRAEEEADTSADPKESLAKLEEGLKSAKANDDDERDAAMTEVVHAIDFLMNDFKNYDEKEQKDVINGIAQVFKYRAKEGEDRMYLAAAAGLSEMGERGADVLKGAMKVKHLEKRVEVQATLIEALGKHKDPKNVDLFVKLLNEAEVLVVVAAIKALGEYRDADAGARKEITESLVKQYANTNNLDLREKGTNPVWRERLLAIEVPMNDALAALTLQNFQSAPEWEKWFNDNRNKKW